MTRRTRRNHSPAFKVKVALAAIKGEATLAVLSKRFSLQHIKPAREIFSMIRRHTCAHQYGREHS